MSFPSCSASFDVCWPDEIRFFQQDMLQLNWKMSLPMVENSDSMQTVLRALAHAFQSSQSQYLLELCAGGGGPSYFFSKHLTLLTGKPVVSKYSDLYPNVKRWSALQKENPTVSFITGRKKLVNESSSNQMILLIPHRKPSMQMLVVLGKIPNRSIDLQVLFIDLHLSFSRLSTRSPLKSNPSQSHRTHAKEAKTQNPPPYFQPAPSTLGSVFVSEVAALLSPRASHPFPVPPTPHKITFQMSLFFLGQPKPNG